VGHDALSTQREDLIGGSPLADTDAPTAVGVLSNGGSALCSGVLIAPDLVLTGPGCLDPVLLGLPDQQAVTNSILVVFDRADLINGTNGFTRTASATAIAPGYDATNLQHLLGKVILQQPVTDRTPVPIAWTTPSFVGDTATRIGFGVFRLSSGVPDPNSAGKKYSVDQMVGDCTALLGGGGITNALSLCFDQTAQAGICEGDSGGPTFISLGGTSQLVGIHSFGDQNCIQYGVDTRLDGERPFLCAQDGVCVASCGDNGLQPDPDCPALDAGSDAGTDAGAEMDAGGGSDAGVDAGPTNGDAGSSSDAGPMTTDGGASTGGTGSSSGCQTQPGSPAVPGWLVALAVLLLVRLGRPRSFS
jgi:hypothetical protein